MNILINIGFFILSIILAFYAFQIGWKIGEWHDKKNR